MGQLAGCSGGLVRVCGWVQVGGGGEPELYLADRTGQVLLAGVDVEINPGSAVEVLGRVASAGRGPGAPALVVQRLEVLGPAAAGMPVLESAGLGERLDRRHLDLRRPAPRLVMEVQTTLEHAMRQVWHEQGFIEIHSPRLMATGPRPDELFSLDYFGGRAWLAQSPQFYKQMAMTAGLDRVFEVGPVFRAEPAISARHGTEFTSIDVEISWISSEDEVMAHAEELLAAGLGALADRHGPAIAATFGTRIEVPETPFPRVSLAEAWEVVERRGHPGPAHKGGGSGSAGGSRAKAGRGDRPQERSRDLDPEAERLLSEHGAEHHGHRLVWVTDYPEELRPFYHMRSSAGSALTRSFDLVWAGLEVASGAQREHRHGQLMAQAAARVANLDPIAHYLEFFRHGCPPHGGFAFGLNRLLMCALGLCDVREATLLPRDRLRLAP